MKVAAECPGCGTGVEIEPGRRTADLFCPRCDYPLFWVPQPTGYVAPEGEDAGITDAVLRRRPGAAGVRLPATLPCPACSELNPVLAELCLRCGSPMHPVPEPEPVVVAAPPPPAPEPEPDDPIWPWILAAVIAGLLILGAIVVWVA